MIFCTMASPDHLTPGASHPKFGSDYAEKEIGAIFPEPAVLLSESHKSYLIERHGTLDLDPIPSMDSADPYNWPSWKISGIGTVFRIPS
ncbi:unnamed protein product [Penicillium nalgiovense]|uniref:Uncharacterized protein n=1 Tax=Penicillium nalgiovense TaxID=60175 RepID=A0A9W4MN99_PENNA|nr:unnamed protein product [Penicillium nalgiovense]CAG7966223.1 unnamed protein product [Penicillium nalgiovense]CAG7982746.1 unnamed protein product [Penicillium nalgiovense]CAG7990970.1 unnamed protein product [Penicillium nalgiovense]CAG7991301.1 unnamed protein product [Penicillium nalgiovense]